MTIARRFRLDAEAFLALCGALTAARTAAGMGRLGPLTPEQVADSCRVIAGLNAAGGWPAPGAVADDLADPAATALLRYIGPVLCETTESRLLLEQAVRAQGLPGRFEPDYPERPALPPPDRRVVPPKVEVPTLSGTILAEAQMRLRRLAPVAGLALALWIAVQVSLSGSGGIGDCGGAAATGGLSDRMAGLGQARGGLSDLPDTPEHGADGQNALPRGGISDLPATPGIAAGGLSDAVTGWRLVCPAQGTGTGGVVTAASPPRLPLPPVGSAPATDPKPRPVTPEAEALGPLDRALSALEAAGHDMTPLQLAERLAGSAAFGLNPGVVLAAMLARSPLPPDRPIPRSETGVLALVNWGIAVAELEGDAGAATEIRQRVTRGAAPDPVQEFVPVDPTGPDVGGDADEKIVADAFPTLARVLDGVDPRLTQHAASDLRQLVEGLPFLQSDQLQNQFIAGAPTSEQLAATLGVAIAPDTGTEETMALAEAQIVAVLAGSYRQALVGWPALWDAAPWLPLALALVWLVAGALRAALWQPEVLPLVLRPGLALTLPVPERGRLPDLRAAARALRFSRPLRTRRLDVPATLAATLRQGGFVTPVPRARRRTTDMVVLIRRQSLSEHEPRRMAALWRGLEQAGVQLRLYEYAAHPGRVRPFGQSRAPELSLDAVAAAQPGARLAIVSTGEEFAGPGGSAMPWEVVAALRAWPERVALTPVAVADWGLREHGMARQLEAVVVPCGAAGPAALARVLAPDQGLRARPAPGMDEEPWLRLPPDTDRDPLSWLERQRSRWDAMPGQASLPPALRLSRGQAASAIAPDWIGRAVMLQALARFLGDRGKGQPPDEMGMVWLAACASYPVLRYPLTVWLGAQLFPGADEERAKLLARLCRLPWFDLGRMPDWLRHDLRDGLSADEHRKIEACFADFYMNWDLTDRSSSDADSGTSEGWRVRLEHDPALRERVDGLETARSEAMVEDRSRTRRKQDAMRRTLLDRSLVVGAALLLGAVLAQLWPDRGAVPLPPGVWLPPSLALALLAAGLVVVPATVKAVDIVRAARLRAQRLEALIRR